MNMKTAATILALCIMNVAVNAGECERILLDKRGESITAVRGQSIGLIDIYDTMIIEMDVAIGLVDSSSSETWESVFHIGRINDERWPGIWLHSTAGTDGTLDGFTLSYGENNNGNNYVAQTAAGNAFSDNSVISYKSIQTQSSLTIMEDGVTTYNQSYNAHPTTTSGDINVYIGDPWYEPADVTITNLVISTMVECDCSAVDIDGYLTQCSDVFDQAETNIGGLRADIDANTADIATNAGDIATNQGEINNLKSSTATLTTGVSTNAADIAANAGDISTNQGDISTNAADISDIKDDIEDIQKTLALIANIGSSQSSTLFDLDINHQNYILLGSLIVNVILALLAYCMYTTIKNNKPYSKIVAYSDSDNIN